MGKIERIEVPAADRARLEALVRDRNTPQKVVWRARIVLLTGAHPLRVPHATRPATVTADGAYCRDGGRLVTTPYGAAFYADRRVATRHAAERLLSILAQHVAFSSIADVGCGTGTWLAAAMRLGAKRTIGYEGTWVEASELDDDRISFVQVDLEQPLAGAKVDVVMLSHSS